MQSQKLNKHPDIIKGPKPTRESTCTYMRDKHCKQARKQLKAIQPVVQLTTQTLEWAQANQIFKKGAVSVIFSVTLNSRKTCLYGSKRQNNDSVLLTITPPVHRN